MRLHRATWMRVSKAQVDWGTLRRRETVLSSEDDFPEVE
jgi:hypothetical protein